MCEYFHQCSCNVKFYAIPKIHVEMLRSLLLQTWLSIRWSFCSYATFCRRKANKKKRQKMHINSLATQSSTSSQFVPVSSFFQFFLSILLSESFIHFPLTTKTTTTMNGLRFYSRILNLTEWLVAWDEALHKTRNILNCHLCKQEVFLQPKSNKKRGIPFFVSFCSCSYDNERAASNLMHEIL